VTNPANERGDALILTNALHQLRGRAWITRRLPPRETDWSRYKDRNLVERFWSKAKQYRRVATRFEKKAQNFLAFVHVASIMIMLR